MQKTDIFDKEYSDSLNRLYKENSKLTSFKWFLDTAYNWAYKKDKLPIFQIHLYGRASNTKMQKWPESLYFPDWDSGFYSNNKPLNDEDIYEIKKQIEMSLGTEKLTTDTYFYSFFLSFLNEIL